MANYREASVVFCDTTGMTVLEGKEVCGVKYIGNTNGTATIKHGGSGGDVIYEAAGTASIFEDVHFTSNDGIYIEVTNGAKLYVYLK